MLSIILPNKSEPHIHKFIEEVERILPANEVLISNDPLGRGKGWAIREALLHAKGDIVAFIDSDGDIKARMLLRMLPFIEDYDAVVGSKRITRAPLHRRVLTYASRLYIRLMFGIPFDTQTGIKVFRRSALNYWRTNGFLFDVEILAIAMRRKLKIIEIPIDVEIRKSMSHRAIWRTFCESLCLLCRL